MSACQPECDVTTYTGTLTFSQISSLATKSLLNAHRARFDSQYTDARELYDRLTHGNSYLASVTSLAASTVTLTNQLSIMLSHVTAFNTSLYLFDDILWTDMESAITQLNIMKVEQ